MGGKRDCFAWREAKSEHGEIAIDGSLLVAVPSLKFGLK